MKKIGIVLFLVVLSLSVSAQDISGKWNGILKAGGVQLRLVFHITKIDSGYTAVMDSPDQGAKGIPVTKTNYKQLVLMLEVASAGITYKGKLNENNIFEGTFTQGMLSVPLKLTKKNVEKEAVVRPQEPLKPYPYYSEDVKFINEKDNIELAGTLTLPDKRGKFPAVVLISGSGPQNRDEELLNHKPFLVLSDYLTNHGIAVLRFDDRGTAQSSGDFNTALTSDFAADAEYAVKYLKSRNEIDKSKIGLIGHSEGGIIAAMAASKNKSIGFIVLMAGSMLRGDKQLLLQKYKIETQLGINQQAIDKGQAIFKEAYKIILNEELAGKQLRKALSDHFKSHYPENQSKELVNQLTLPWFVNFLRLDPVIYLKKVTCPILAVNGSKDLQVPAEENLNVVRTVFHQQKHVTVKEMANLNHLLQECNTGLPNEYGVIQQTISSKALKEITDWILKQVKE